MRRFYLLANEHQHRTWRGISLEGRRVQPPADAPSAGISGGVTRYQCTHQVTDDV